MQINKKLFLLPALLMLLPSCNAPVDPDVAAIQYFVDNITSLEGNVKTATYSNATGRFYGPEFAMYTGYNKTSTRYINFVETKGRSAILNDRGGESSASNYTEQISKDPTFFYKVTKFDDPSWSSEDKITVLAYNPEHEASVFSLSLVYDLKNDASAMLQYRDREDIRIEQKNMDGLVTSGRWKFSYTLTFLEYDEEEETVLDIISEQITVKVTLTIDKGVITKAEQDYTDDIYVGGIKANWINAYTEVTYTQGEFEEFTGTKLPVSSI